MKEKKVLLILSLFFIFSIKVIFCQDHQMLLLRPVILNENKLDLNDSNTFKSNLCFVLKIDTVIIKYTDKHMTNKKSKIVWNGKAYAASQFYEMKSLEKILKYRITKLDVSISERTDMLGMTENSDCLSYKDSEGESSSVQYILDAFHNFYINKKSFKITIHPILTMSNKKIPDNLYAEYTIQPR
jgi:hypothetical protein